MNAYELADEAYKKATTRFDYDVALTMKQLIQENSQQADRIAELEKQGEPVAWMSGNEICPEIGYEATITAEHPKNLGWIPLYTTPQTKPLSDEEITMIGLKHLECVDDCYIQRFARAIEERHGIK